MSTGATMALTFAALALATLSATALAMLLYDLLCGWLANRSDAFALALTLALVWLFVLAVLVMGRSSLL